MQSLWTHFLSFRFNNIFLWIIYVESFNLRNLSAEHGVGQLKKAFMPLARGSAELAVMKSVKAALDPKGILNPGKLYPSEWWSL